MKKFYRLSAFYAILGIVCGVFYREFTKFNGFTGTTTLSFMHTHTFILGMFFFLILIIFEKQYIFSHHKKINLFLGTYNAGLLLTLCMLLVRGLTQVLNTTLTNGMSAAISGVAGVGHILLCVGLLSFFLILKDHIKSA